MSVGVKRIPSCLGNVTAVLCSTGQANSRSYKIACKCGCCEHKLLGYRPESQSLSGERVFVSPLSIECSSCGTRAMFFDSELHGYDGENASGVAMTGTGEPESWNCPQCGAVIVEVEVVLTYNVEPDEENRERAEDFFSEVAVDCKCRECKAECNATSIDCI